MNLLIGAPSPHIRDGITTQKIMLAVILALVPSCIAGVVIFGWYALAVLAVSVATAVVCEALMCRILKRKNSVGDLSAALTGLLVGMNMPPHIPLYVPAVAAAFAIIIVKQFFGGLGKNFVNPALTGRAFVMAAWTAMMSTYTIPTSISGVDATSSATTLSALKMGATEFPSLLDSFVGTIGGCIGEVSAAALLLGGVVLIALRIIDWKIPAFYIGTVAVFMGIFGFATGVENVPYFVALHLLSGSLFLGAFFMATDYVTSPVKGAGKIIFAVGCGIITCVIRLWGAYPEGVSYSILIMNLAVPLIDKATVGRIFGKKRGLKNA